MKTRFPIPRNAKSGYAQGGLDQTYVERITSESYVDLNSKYEGLKG